MTTSVTGDASDAGAPRAALTGRTAIGAAAVLAAVAGYVDAFVYLRVAAVFVANQSGNLILGGIGVAGGEVGDVALLAAAVLSYVAGAAVATAAFGRSGANERHRAMGTLAAVIVVLGGCALALSLAGQGRVPSPRSALVLGVVCAAAAALGAQATLIRRAGDVSVLTTASTGSVTSIGVELGSGTILRDPRSRSRVLRLCAVVVAYVGGAVLGGALSVHTDRGPELLAGPCAVLAVALGSLWVRTVRGSAAGPSGPAPR